MVSTIAVAASDIHKIMILLLLLEVDYSVLEQMLGECCFIGHVVKASFY